MNESAIGGIGKSIAGIGQSAPASPSIDDGGDGRFGSILDSLTELELQAEAGLTDLAIGGDRDLADVVLAVEMESIAFELATQIRNRLVDTYQEIFRMNV